MRDSDGARTLHRRASAGRTLRLLLLTSASLAAFAGAGWAAEGDETAYSFDVELAPVCLEGTFPLSIAETAGATQGLLTVETDVRGKLTGSLEIGGKTFAVTGSVQFGTKRSTVVLVARSGKDRLDLKGALGGNAFSGTSTGKGSVAKGKHPFSLDVSSATPEMARVDVLLTEGKKGKVSGAGTVLSCGESVGLKAAGKTTKFTVSSGKVFRFTAKFDGAAYDWSADGFGAIAVGQDLELDPLEAPSDFTYSVPVAEYEADLAATPNTPVGSTNPRGRYTINPALPGGLTLDPATGTISGSPTEIRALASYTVTASNAAGSTTAAVQIRTRTNRADSFAPETRALDDDAKRHFLTRTKFAVRQADFDALGSSSLDAQLDAMLTFQSGTAAETTAYAELVNTSDPVGLEGKFPSTSQVARWWANLMMNNPNAFQEQVAFFWHDHFAVGTQALDSTVVFAVDYANLYRHEGNGNLRTLLVKMARDPAMLVYLDGVLNTRTAPNENFGREFWELFTLGVDNGYTQEDIVAVSKAWSGYRLRFDTTTNVPYVQFDTTRHDANPKTFLGTTIAGQNVTDDFQAVVDTTLANRPVAEFITKKIFEHFCYDGPPDALVTEMANYLRSQNYELAPFFRALLKSEAFFSAKARRGKVKNPLEFGVGFIRATGLQIRTSSLDTSLNTLGQRPSQPPTVNGWPLGELWLSSQGMADRTNLAYTVVEDTSRQNTAGMNVANILPADRSAANVVDHLAGLLNVVITDADRTAFTDYLNTQRQTGGTIVQSPFNGTNQTHLDERVRGLLLIMAQHPTYHVR